MRFDYSFQSGFLIGYTFSLVSVVTIFMSYCVPWAHLKRMASKRMSTPPVMTSSMARREAERKIRKKKFLDLEKLITRMSFTALNNATYCFNQDNVIGVGNMGTMYKARLPYSDCLIAVQRVHDSLHLHKQFFNVLKIMGRYKHMNIVPLMGFCVESRERLLVYKYMPNGSLNDWLRPMDVKSTKVLDFHFRVKIAKGVARGLAWLHHYNNFQIAHCNISSSCILLDETFEPKISKFEGAMFFLNLVEINESLIKSDVYDFGVLLLELITHPAPKETLAERICHSRITSSLYSVVDKSLFGCGFDQEILHLHSIACSCTTPLSDQRPTMVEVYQKLMAIKNINNLSKDSESLIQIDASAADNNYDRIELEITEIQG